MKPSRLLLGLAASLIVAVFPACRSERVTFEKADSAPQAALLFPGLEERLGTLDRIDLKSSGGELTLEKRDGQWRLAKPFEVPVYGPYLNQALISLLQTPAGQQLVLTKQETKMAGLNTDGDREQWPSPDTVQVTLNFEVGEPERFVVGGFDNRTHAEETVAYGEAATARRFVQSADGLIHLTPANLTAFTPKVDVWEGRNFPPLKRLSEIVVTTPDGFSWKASKTSSFSPISLEPQAGQADVKADLIRVFDTFLVKGFHHGVVVGALRPAHYIKPMLKLIARDRFGANYRLEVIRPLTASERMDQEALPGAKLRKGFLGMEQNEGGADRWICQLQVEKADSSPQEQLQAATLAKHFILLAPDDLHDLLEVTKKLKNRHEQS